MLKFIDNYSSFGKNKIKAYSMLNQLFKETLSYFYANFVEKVLNVDPEINDNKNEDKYHKSSKALNFSRDGNFLFWTLNTGSFFIVIALLAYCTMSIFGNKTML